MPNLKNLDGRESSCAVRQYNRRMGTWDTDKTISGGHALRLETPEAGTSSVL